MGNTQNEESTIDHKHEKFKQCIVDGSNLVLSPEPGPFLNDWIRRVREFEHMFHPEHRLLLPKIE